MCVRTTPSEHANPIFKHESTGQRSATDCSNELKAIEKKIDDLNDRILALVLKAGRSDEENAALDLMKT
jgi:hypothetical protein